MKKKPKTNWRELLPYFCDRDMAREDEASRFYMLSRPWVLKWRESTWTVATDGRHLVMVDGVYCDDEATKKITETMLGVLDQPTTQRKHAKLSLLKEWCKEPHSLKLTTCPDCRGAGRDICEHCEREGDCDNCAGTGRVIEEREKSQGWIRGVYLDRARLAHCLRGCQGGEVFIDTNEQQTAIVVSLGEWRVILMGLIVENEWDEERAKKAPHFEAFEEQQQEQLAEA